MGDKSRKHKMVQGARRTAWLENGGDLGKWRARPATFADRKQEKARLACRGRTSWEE